MYASPSTFWDHISQEYRKNTDILTLVNLISLCLQFVFAAVAEENVSQVNESELNAEIVI